MKTEAPHVPGGTLFPASSQGQQPEHGEQGDGCHGRQHGAAARVGVGGLAFIELGGHAGWGRQSAHVARAIALRDGQTELLGCVERHTVLDEQGGQVGGICWKSEVINGKVTAFISVLIHYGCPEQSSGEK